MVFEDTRVGRSKGGRVGAAPPASSCYTTSARDVVIMADGWGEVRAFWLIDDCV
jgi:hypothetical protein